ncbi:MAG: oligosaccharide flippase family protein [Syntrophomonadaceae bacterium]
MKKFLQNWSLLTVSNFVYQGLLFLSFVRIARLLKPELYGQFTIILTATSIAQVFSSLGLQKIVIREIARDHSKSLKVAKLSIVPIALATLLSGLFLVFYLVKIESFSDFSLLLLAAILFVALTVWNYAEPIAFGKQQMEISAYLNALSSIVFTASIFLLPSERYSLPAILVLYAGVFFLRAVVYLLWEWKNNYFSGADQKNDPDISTGYLLKRSMAYYGTNLLALPTVQLPVLLLGQFSGEKEVGYYGISNKLSMPLTLIATNLLTALYPILAKYYVENKDLFIQRTRKVFLFLAISGLVFTGVLGFFSRELVSIILGVSYEPAIETFTIQVWVALNLILHSFIATIFLSTDKENLMVKLSIFNSIVIGAFCYFGAYYGAIGLSVSSWIGLLIGFSFHWYFLSKSVGIKLGLYLNNVLFACFVLLSVLSFILVEYNIMVRSFAFVASVAFIWLLLRKNLKGDVIKLIGGVTEYVK